MKKVNLNQDWLYIEGTAGMIELFAENAENSTHIDLPHDAMIHKERTPYTKNGHQTGFYPGGEYTYIKYWHVPSEWKTHTIELEFEGVADTCHIYLNGDFIAEHVNPYTSIWIDVTNCLNFGQMNELKVEVRSVEQSSRWYSGAGVYRPVNAWIGGLLYIPAHDIRVTTLEAYSDIAVVEVIVPIRNRRLETCSARVKTTLLAQDGVIASEENVPLTIFGESCEQYRQRLTVEKPLLWSDETPDLYTCRVQIFIDEEEIDRLEIPVGIRTLGLNAKQGLLINGKQTKLRGACIHHDNGVIGAATFPDAEYRRCRQLKKAGFNAIRSAHHPMSKAMLDACDQLGMLVMDELSDLWTRTKNPHDYANYFPTHWKQDVRDMVEKDYNHPSVIIYSTGNEIPEAGTARGAAWNRRIDGEIKRLDSTRYTTTAINGLGAGVEKLGEIICHASGMTEEEFSTMQQPDKGGHAGADVVNGMAEVMIGPLADAIATSPILEALIGETASVNDIAGYNYLTALHEEEHSRHPGRVVLGTETFPADIVQLWNIVMRNPHVLGDFTWAGYDYLGEAGCGIFHYDGGENFAAHWPDRLAGIGDIDILGNRKPISYLRQAVFGIGHIPAIGVLRMDKADKKVKKTPWMWKDNIANWTWHGYEGKAASVDIYANADEVELILNDKSYGRRKIKNKYIVTYEIPYEPGVLEAISYVNGNEAGRTALQTAGEARKLEISVDRKTLPADGESLAFVKICLVDENGNLNQSQEEKIAVAVEGSGVLQGFGSADPSCEGSYQSNIWKTYDGVVMAVIRSSLERGKIKIIATSENCGRGEIFINEEY